MSRFLYYNPNPKGRQVGDCTVRAISCALDQEWGKVYADLCLQGYEMGDMPSSDAVWGAYLRRQGFRRHLLPDTCPDCYTVEEFAAEHPQGVYILSLSGHVVTVVDGMYYDTWESGDKIPLFYWTMEDDKGGT